MPRDARAQAPVATQEGYASCSVTDTGSAQAKIWASPVFAFRHRSDDPAGFQRLNSLAGEFLSHVNALGGAGTKTCEYAATRAEAEAAREQHRAIWDKRVYFIKIGDWREVPWTPAPWDPAQQAALPAQLTRYFTCSAVQMDLPDRSDRSRAVASQVFSMSVPSSDPVAMYNQARAYEEQFKAVAQAHAVVDQHPNCMPYDTRAEADKALVDQRRLLDGFNQKYTEISWQPTATATATPTAEPQTVTPPVAANADASAVAQPAMTSTPAKAAQTSALISEAANVHTTTAAESNALYCAAFVSRTKPAAQWRAPAQQQADTSIEHARLAATLARFLQSVQSANPGKWFELKPATCYPNSAVFPGETFCFTAEYKHFGGMQSAGMYCNASREQIDKRVQDMAKADGGQAQIVAWP